MTNIIKMDAYRMLKSPFTWIILLAAMLMMFGSVFVASTDVAYYEKNPGDISRLEDPSDNKWGIRIGDIESSWCAGNEIPLVELVSTNIQFKVPLMFLLVFLVFFVNGDSRTGYIKNIATHVKKRKNLIILKILPVAIYSALLLLVSSLAVMLGSKIFFGYVNFDNFASLLPFMGTQLLLHIAFGMFIICLLTLLRNSLASMIIGLLIASGLIEIVDVILVAIVPNLSKTKELSIMPYITSGNIGLLSVDGMADIYLRSLIVALIYTVFMTGISMYVFGKRDIE